MYVFVGEASGWSVCQTKFGTQTRMVIALAVQSSKQKPDKGSILATTLCITVFMVMYTC